MPEALTVQVMVKSPKPHLHTAVRNIDVCYWQDCEKFVFEFVLFSPPSMTKVDTFSLQLLWT